MYHFKAIVFSLVVLLIVVYQFKALVCLLLVILIIIGILKATKFIVRFSMILRILDELGRRPI